MKTGASGVLGVASDRRASPRSGCVGRRWYAVHTHPHRETGAARQLQFQGYCVFLPTALKTVRHARKFRTVKAPFFPRYLFVQLDLGVDRWRSVNGTFGVSSLVMEGERPKPVPTGVVEGLGALSGDDGVLSFAPSLKPGERVRMLSGPFAHQIGELQHIDEHARVRVLLDLMGGRVVVNTTAEALAPLH